MSLRYSCCFLVLAVLHGLIAAKYWNSAPLLTLMLLYAAFSFGLLATAYAGLGAVLLLKARSGRMTLGSSVLFAPYLCLSEFLFRIYRSTNREAAFVEVCPNLFFGRRLTRSEADQGIKLGWISVLDLAVEFSEVAALRELPGYFSLPILDGTAPSPRQMDEAVDWIQRSKLRGSVYVHCALGHGRSACMIVAYLISTNEVSTAGEGEAFLRGLRHGVRLNSAQSKAIDAYRTRCKSII